MTTLNISKPSGALNQFVWVMRIYVFVYIVGTILFFFMPEELFYLINIGPKVFKMFEEIPQPSEHFWIVLTTSMLVMLCALSWFSSRSPETKSFVFIHLLSKGTSVAGFLYVFFKHKPYFAYLIGAVCDASIFLTILGFYLRAMAKGNALKPAAAA